jgi:hypothetical protein
VKQANAAADSCRPVSVEAQARTARNALELRFTSCVPYASRTARHDVWAGRAGALGLSHVILIRQDRRSKVEDGRLRTTRGHAVQGEGRIP